MSVKIIQSPSKKGTHLSMTNDRIFQTGNIHKLRPEKRRQKTDRSSVKTGAPEGKALKTLPNISDEISPKVYNLKTAGVAIERLCAWREIAAGQIACLTDRQLQIMGLVLEGYSSKIIAANLGISQRTVVNHRALIIKKTGSRSLPALTRLALAATWNNPGESAA